VQISKDDSGKVLRLSGKLTIMEAEELRVGLSDFLRGDVGLTIDLSQADKCDTSALQLLYSARKTAEIKGIRLEFCNLSDVVRSSSEEIGFRLSDLTAAAEATSANDLVNDCAK